MGIQFFVAYSRKSDFSNNFHFLHVLVVVSKWFVEEEYEQATSRGSKA